MAEHILNTRIQLKYDTYENWCTNNPVLKAGEVAIATIPDNQDGVKNAPSILIKVGDGESEYKTLKFVSGLAADVAEWAKAEDKPEYTADEIDGLADYIAGKVENTDTQYRVIKVDDYNYKLQSKTLSGEWADVAENGTIVIPKYDDTTISENVQSNMDKIDILTDGPTDVNKSVREIATEVVEANAYDDTQIKADVQHVADIVDVLTNAEQDANKTIRDIADEQIAASAVDYSVTVTESSPEGYAKAYTLTQNGKDITTINIPKDMVVESGSVVTDPDPDHVGTYLKLVLANATEDEIFINVTDLIEYVTSGSEAEDQIQIYVSADHKVTASLKDGSIALAQLDTDLQSAVTKANSALQATDTFVFNCGDSSF